MNKRDYPLSEIFNKPTMKQTVSGKIGSGAYTTEYKYVEQEIRDYVEDLEPDEIKIDFLNRLLNEIRCDFSIGWVKKNFKKFNNPRQMDYFIMYFEVLRTEKYLTQSLKYYKRKLKIEKLKVSKKNHKSKCPIHCIN